MLNQRVVEMAVRPGWRSAAPSAAQSVFARKNYFYPDLPKGYQISQYELPICEGGAVPFTVGAEEKVARLTRIHMEEDAGKNVHGVSDDGASGVDLQPGRRTAAARSSPSRTSARPTRRSSTCASLRAILMALGVSDGNMEEGSLRCDANVSVMRKGAEKLGTRCEIKNINSFRFVHAAIEYEISAPGGGARGRAAGSCRRRGSSTRTAARPAPCARRRRRTTTATSPSRTCRRCGSPAELVERLRAALPELPRARSLRYQRDLGLSAYDAGVLVSDAQVAGWFDRALAAYGGGAEAAKKVANWLNGEVARLANESATGPAEWKLTPEKLAAVLKLMDAGIIGGPGAKQVVEEVFRAGGDPAAVVEAKGLAQVSDEGAIEAVVDRVLAASPAEVERHRSGKKNLTGFFVGQVMKELRGKGNPAVVNALLRKKLGG